MSFLRKPVDDEIEKLYEDCFGRKMLHLRYKWVPHIICNSCRFMLYRVQKSEIEKYLKFSTLAVWKKPVHTKDFYFCMNDFKGINTKNKASLSYINVSTLIRPTVKVERFCPELDTCVKVERQSDEKSSVSGDNDTKEDNYVLRKSSKNPQLLSQIELNDFIRDLGLPKDSCFFHEKKKLFEIKHESNLLPSQRLRIPKIFYKRERHSFGILH